MFYKIDQYYIDNNTTLYLNIENFKTFTYI